MLNTDIKKIIRVSFLSITLVFIVVYVFFRTRDLVTGVKIRDVNIVDGGKMNDNIVKITGNAKNALNITIDDREISIDQQGNFDETIALLPGYNAVKIKAQDKFGNSDEKNYKLIY